MAAGGRYRTYVRQADRAPQRLQDVALRKLAQVQARIDRKSRQLVVTAQALRRLQLTAGRLAGLASLSDAQAQALKAKHLAAAEKAVSTRRSRGRRAINLKGRSGS